MMKLDNKRFSLVVLLIVSGIAMLFIAMFIDPTGQIHGSVLGAAGEVFILAGGLMGIGEAFLSAIKGISRITDDEIERVKSVTRSSDDKKTNKKDEK